MTKSTLATIGLVAAIIVFTDACDSLPTAEDTETEENLAAMPLEDILDDVPVEDDVMAIAKVIRGEMLPPNGNHFFLVSADGAASILRKCDRTVIARIPAEARLVWSKQTGNTSRSTWTGGTMARVAAGSP